MSRWRFRVPVCELSVEVTNCPDRLFNGGRFYTRKMCLLFKSFLKWQHFQRRATGCVRGTVFSLSFSLTTPWSLLARPTVHGTLGTSSPPRNVIHVVWPTSNSRGVDRTSPKTLENRISRKPSLPSPSGKKKPTFFSIQPLKHLVARLLQCGNACFNVLLFDVASRHQWQTSNLELPPVHGLQRHALVAGGLRGLSRVHFLLHGNQGHFAGGAKRAWD